MENQKKSNNDILYYYIKTNEYITIDNEQKKEIYARFLNCDHKTLWLESITGDIVSVLDNSVLLDSQ